ncbi:23S rRNA (adenine(2503)-C(2))-methyltransferase RlmN [Mycoplasma sp. P36-A1]|uniref:23S rRNA (adenine(2503)-C(2))-methyltransferase RlmN n=1 Tax=Mycoplasma sp. P36-A1 TaxID=3252900 RepID=UPI003C2C9EBB
MKYIYDLNLEDLEEYFLQINEKKYRAKQVYEWLYVKRVDSFEKMSNLSKNIIAQLNESFYFDELILHTKQESLDGTIKYLFKLKDGNYIETVLMRYNYGNSVCVSSQIGCNMGCAFCASGQLKKVKDLTSGQITAQVMLVQKDIEINEERVSHVVVMGIGEPFDNYDNVMKFIRNINNPFGLAIGARHITISTCGIIEGINKYMNEDLQTNLAISLHSAINETRSKLMPINVKDDLQVLKESINQYIQKTNRRVTFEYILLKGINDSEEDAKNLIKYARGMNVYINLIPYNSVDNTTFKNVSRNEANKFSQYLKDAKINVTIRKEHGTDIDAACGQLRSKKEKEWVYEEICNNWYWKSQRIKSRPSLCLYKQ